MIARPRRLQSLIITAGLLLALVVAPPSAAQAQISSDRPSFSDGASTVGSGTFQTELGYAYNGNGITTQELGQLLLRYGLTDNFELRGGVNSYVIVESPIDNGYAGSSVGAKYRFMNTQTSSLSGVATTSLPTETGPFDTRDDRARQQLALAYDGMLGEGLTLSLNGGVSFFYSAGNQENRFLEWLFIPTVSFNITESASAYVGYAGFYNEAANRNWVEGGLTVLSSANTQFDVNTGLRIDENSDRFFFGVGVAHRF